MSKLNRLNQYRILWVFVFFDLPTETKKERREYARFRKLLIKDGFTMIQYSIYARHCTSRENSDVHIKRVKSFLPSAGEVILFTLTDKQFGMMEFFKGFKEARRPDTPQQLELFLTGIKKTAGEIYPRQFTTQFFYPKIAIMILYNSKIVLGILCQRS